jgi:soluble lytic murein transglycosylase
LLARLAAVALLGLGAPAPAEDLAEAPAVAAEEAPAPAEAAAGEARAPAEAAAAPREPAPAVAAALREALAAEPEQAAEAFARVAERAPAVADHAGELRIEALLAAGLHAEGIAAVAAYPGTNPGPWLRARVAAHEGALHVALGDERAARAAFARAQPHADATEHARLEAEIAASWERSGDAAQAARHWQVVYTRWVTEPAATEAADALARLAAADATFEYRTADALRERCQRLSQALRNEPALVECDAALAKMPGDRALLHQRAQLLFRMRRYPEAVTAFEALGAGDVGARFWRARSLARSGRIAASIETFDGVARRAGPELAARSRFLAGTLHEDDDVARAAAAYRTVAETAPLASQRAAARWRLAWLAWRSGDLAAARKAFTRYLEDEQEPVGRQRGRYWRARTLQREGLAEGDATHRALAAKGDAELRALAQEAPLSYYGWRAGTRHAALAPVAASAGPDTQPAPAATRAPADPALPPAATRAPADPALPPALLRRIEILLGAGLEERAAREVRPLAGRAASRSRRLALGQLLLEAGQFQRAQRLVVDAHLHELAGPPAAGEEMLWWLAWPTAFDTAVEPAASANGIPAALVYAIMREESGYQPDALSVVGARGLTQIMPDTGRRLARDLGASSFDPEELFVPVRNVELGAFYLARLLQRFEGRFSAAIASYNAGPEAVARWLASGAALEDDEWVEAIPYDQTRSYVKRVLRSIHAYRTLYDGMRGEAPRAASRAVPRSARAEPEA